MTQTNDDNSFFLAAFSTNMQGDDLAIMPQFFRQNSNVFEFSVRMTMTNEVGVSG